jgi:hypothetical protein
MPRRSAISCRPGAFCCGVGLEEDVFAVVDAGAGGEDAEAEVVVGGGSAEGERPPTRSSRVFLKAEAPNWTRVGRAWWGHAAGEFSHDGADVGVCVEMRDRWRMRVMPSAGRVFGPRGMMYFPEQETAVGARVI